MCVHAFDLMRLSGRDLREAPLEQRQARLRRLLARSRGNLIVAQYWVERSELGSIAAFSPWHPNWTEVERSLAHALRSGAETGRSWMGLWLPTRTGRAGPLMRILQPYLLQRFCYITSVCDNPSE